MYIPLLMESMHRCGKKHCGVTTIMQNAIVVRPVGPGWLARTLLLYITRDILLLPPGTKYYDGWTSLTTLHAFIAWVTGAAGVDGQRCTFSALGFESNFTSLSGAAKAQAST